MQDEKYEQTKNSLRREIESLRQYYQTLREYIAGKRHDTAEALETLSLFKEGLSRISAHILTLYVLKGQKTKITWDSLLVNIDNALESSKATLHPNPQTAIELAFNMSEPKAQDVMTYLEKLEASL